MVGDTTKALAFLERYNAKSPNPRPWALILQGDLRVRRGLVAAGAGQHRPDRVVAPTGELEPHGCAPWRVGPINPDRPGQMARAGPSVKPY